MPTRPARFSIWAWKGRCPDRHRGLMGCAQEGGILLLPGAGQRQRLGRAEPRVGDARALVEGLESLTGGSPRLWIVLPAQAGKFGMGQRAKCDRFRRSAVARDAGDHLVEVRQHGARSRLEPLDPGRVRGGLLAVHQIGLDPHREPVQLSVIDEVRLGFGDPAQPLEHPLLRREELTAPQIQPDHPRLRGADQLKPARALHQRPRLGQQALGHVELSALRRQVARDAPRRRDVEGRRRRPHRRLDHLLGLDEAPHPGQPPGGLDSQLVAGGAVHSQAPGRCDAFDTHRQRLLRPSRVVDRLAAIDVCPQDLDRQAELVGDAQSPSPTRDRRLHVADEADTRSPAC